MKIENLLRLAVLGISVGLACTAMAQAAEGTGDSEREGQVIPPLPTPTEIDGPTAAPGSAVDRLQLSDNVKTQLQDFEQQRERYLETQREQSQNAAVIAEADRERIRETIRDARQAWVNAAEEYRENARDRLAALKEALPSHSELLDAAKEQAREQLRQGFENAGAGGRRGLD